MKNFDDEEVFRAVRQLLAQARAKHRTWPNDPIHGVAIVCEESGELIRAALNMVYEGASQEKVLTEACHTIVTAVRFITKK